MGYRSGARRTRAWERGCGTQPRPHSDNNHPHKLDHISPAKKHSARVSAKPPPPLKGCGGSGGIDFPPRWRKCKTLTHNTLQTSATIPPFRQPPCLAEVYVAES